MDSLPQHPTDSSLQNRKFSATGSRKRSLIGLAIILALSAALAYGIYANFVPSAFRLLGIVLLLALASNLRKLIWPPRIDIEGRTLRVSGPLILETPLASLRGFGYLGDTVRIVLRDLAHVQPATLRNQLDQQFHRSGAHLELSGFSPAQFHELCQTLGMTEQGPDASLARTDGFYQTLMTLSPNIRMTYAIIAVNVLVYVAMVVKGVSPMTPTHQDLITWGSNFGPVTLSGQWWRLLTCTFLHIGALHIALNMWVLLDIGRLMERLLGAWGFLTLYLLSGVLASLTSLAWNPLVNSAGASGAVFGMFGALLGFLALNRASIPQEVFLGLRNSGMSFVGYNLVFGFLSPGIDNAAHIGGLVAGFLGGLVLSQPLDERTPRGRLLRNTALLFGGALLVFGSEIGLREYYANDLEIVKRLADFEVGKQKQLNRFRTALQRNQKNEMSDTELADFIDDQIVRTWSEARRYFASVSHPPRRYTKFLPGQVESIANSEEGWRQVAQGLRENDQVLFSQGIRRLQAAGALPGSDSEKLP